MGTGEIPGDRFAYRETLTFQQVVLFQIKNINIISTGDGFNRYYEYGLDDIWHTIPTSKKRQYRDPLLRDKKGKALDFLMAWEKAEKIRNEDKTEDRESGTARKRCILKRRLISDLHYQMGLYFSKPGEEIEQWFKDGDEDDSDTGGETLDPESDE